ncbi:MAG: ComF family protein [Rubrivivax sp.]|nr:ComF family protein [Rubrivivax sp.]
MQGSSDARTPGLARLADALAARLGGACEICRQWSAAAFCSHCLSLHARPQARCPRCALPSAGALVCGRCAGQAPSFERSVAAFDYDFPWDRLTQALKFSGRTELARPLGEALARAAIDAGVVQQVDLLMAVPLSGPRLAERGYNQAELLAQVVARVTGVARAEGWLLRLRDTAHQARLSRADRLRNLEGAFLLEPRHRPALSGRRVALIDDVMTTGATAEAAAAELLRAGAASVQLWAVARTA